MSRGTRAETDHDADSQAAESTDYRGKRRLLRFHRAAPWILLAFGLLWAVLIPPFQTPDEQSHFLRIRVLSEGNFLNWVDGYALDGTVDTGYEIPTDFHLSQISLNAYWIRWDPSQKFSLPFYTNSWDYRINSGEPQFYAFSNTLVYPPTAYPLGIPAWWLLSAINARVVVAALVLRLASLLAWCLVFAWLSRRLPYVRQPILYLFLMPIAVQGAISPSADLAVNTSILIFCTELIRLHTIDRDRLISWKYVLGLTACSLLFVTSKIVYFPVALMALTLGRQHFRHILSWLAAQATIIVIPGIGLAAWMTAVSTHRNMVTATVDARRQSASNWHWFTTAIENIIFNFRQWETYESWYGKLGWVDTSAPVQIVVIFLILLVAVLVLQPAQRMPRIPLWVCLWWTICCCAIAGLLHMATVTYFASNHVIVQVRYYFPLVLPMLFVWQQLRLRILPRLRTLRIPDRYLVLSSIAGLAIMTLVLYHRFY